MIIPVIANLPSLPLADRHLLPDVSAVYFALDAQSQVLYIGKSVHLSDRWRGTSHHRYDQIAIDQNARLAWLTVRSNESLEAIEATCIAHFRPPLNGFNRRGLRKKLLRVKSSAYLPEPIHLWLTEEAERRGLSANDIVILAIELLQQQTGDQ